MRKRSLVMLMILLSGLSLRSEISTVNGRILGAGNLTVRLMAYSDQVSNLRETLATFQAGDDGFFSFRVDITEVLYCWIDIEFRQAELFIRPGQSYEVELKYEEVSTQASYFNRSALPMKIIRDDSSSLNLSIQDFNQIYNDFLLNYSENIRTANARTMFDTFSKAVGMRFRDNSDPYFRDYMRYKTASMQLFMRLKSRDNIGAEYIAGQPVLYGNPEYMDFFHLFFEKYFLTTGKYFNYNKTYDLVNGIATSTAILDSLSRDPVLKDLEVRELLLLDGLRELYGVAGFKRNRIEQLASELLAVGSVPENRRIAGNILVRMKRLSPGTPAPEFKLFDPGHEQEYRLADFRGKYVYLVFFESANPASAAELGQIKEIYEEYSDRVYFVAVSTDKDILKLKEYIGRSGLPWFFLHYGGDIGLLEDYDAFTVPYFLLIDGKGLIVRCPAPGPGENVQKLFDSIPGTK